MAYYNNQNDAYERIFDIVDNALPELEGALLKLALIRKEDGSIYISNGRIVFQQEVESKEQIFEYPKMILYSKWLTIPEIKKTLRSILTGKWQFLDQIISREYALWDDNVRLPDQNSVSGWREFAFVGRSQNRENSDYNYQPLVAFGKPAYASELLAVAEWIYGDSNKEQFVRGMDQLEIVIPDKRGRIEAAMWGPDSLTVDVNTILSTGDLSLQIIEKSGSGLRRNEGELSNSNDTLSKKKFFAEIDDSTDSVELYLIHRDNSLLDFAKMQVKGKDYEAVDGERTIEDIAIDDFENGEGDTVEFKSWIEKGHKKENELLRTVVAFSNTLGGRIYIGVRDDGSVQNGTMLKNAFKCAYQDALNLAVKRVKKLITESLKPLPEFQVLILPMAGENVIVIEVQEGYNTPYALHDNSILVRRGATIKKPEPSKELLYLIQKNPTNRGIFV
ncbi:MAG: ATP-binding protein [Candidatus Aegiribacteria sp.]|nr:ATP-binding protein [Candidatus Aegiribacteria sp.]